MEIGIPTVNYILIISNLFSCCLGSVFFSKMITFGDRFDTNVITWYMFKIPNKKWRRKQTIRNYLLSYFPFSLSHPLQRVFWLLLSL